MTIWNFPPDLQGGNGGSGEPTETQWGDIIGKPSVFPPESHQHEIKDVEDLQATLNGKVDKADGKTLTSNDFTDQEKQTLALVADRTSKMVRSVNDRTGEVFLTKNDVGLSNVDNVKQATKEELETHVSNKNIHVTEQEKQQIANTPILLNGKVDKIEGKDLSTNDFTDEYQTLINQNANGIEVLKELIGDDGELTRNIVAKKTAPVAEANLKNIVVSLEEPSDTYEGLIWIKPVVSEE